MRKHLLMAVPAAAASAATPVYAGDLQVQLEIPRLRVAEYHKPYVAVWIENEAGKTVATLDAWYQTDAKGEDGRKWLPDLRTWWRRAGRAASMPANGISGPTQAPGRYSMQFKEGTRPLSNLTAGAYTLRVEAAREVGGREMVSIPFQWPPRTAMSGSAAGSKELGAVRLTIKP